MITPEFHNFDTLDSTNDTALEMAKNGCAEGTVVLAKAQRKGRGRRGRVWQDECEKSLLMSLVLRPDMNVSEITKLSFTSSLAATQFLINDTGLDASIKWPNDLIVCGKKIGGILVETTNTSLGTAAVIGIGINIGQESFSRDIQDISTSIALSNGRILNIDYAAEILTRYLIKFYELHKRTSAKDILDDWRKYMWGMKQPVEIDTSEGTIKGIIVGIDDDGALLIKKTDSSIEAIHSADAIKTRKIQED